MQDDPLLEQLDWCFTSANYPNTLLMPLSKPTSDHTPCVAQISTSIPKAHLFRFENFWVEQPGFLEIVQESWQTEVSATNSATKLVAKFKILRINLKKWSKSISKINNLIKSCDDILLVLDKLEDLRELFIQEHNFRKIQKEHINKLLHYRQEYWKCQMDYVWR